MKMVSGLWRALSKCQLPSGTAASAAWAHSICIHRPAHTLFSLMQVVGFTRDGHAKSQEVNDSCKHYFTVGPSVVTWSDLGQPPVPLGLCWKMAGEGQAGPQECTQPSPQNLLLTLQPLPAAIPDLAEDSEKVLGRQPHEAAMSTSTLEWTK